MNLVACFDAFLESRVNLTPGRIQTLTEHVKTVEEFLRRADRLGDHLVEVIPQGSFAQRTIIKPPEEGDTFDADVLLRMPFDASMGPEDYVPMLAGAFGGSGRYRNKIDPGKRSVELDYAGEFHIDLVPFIVADNGQFITNCATAEWEETNPQGFNDWLAERDEITFGRWSRSSGWRSSCGSAPTSNSTLPRSRSRSSSGRWLTRRRQQPAPTPTCRRRSSR